MTNDPTKKVLLSVGDGPEGIEIYTSENRAITDWATNIPALYVSVSVNDAQAGFGPFTLSETLIAQLEERLQNPPPTGIRRITCEVGGIAHRHVEEGKVTELECPDEVRRQRDAAALRREPQLGTSEYFALVAREYWDGCGYTDAERPDTHAENRRLLKTLKEVYRAGHREAEKEQIRSIRAQAWPG